jgi:2-octaprenyl-3-methyl-6-methoxy-1,4-benzoquinol hydroxylase
MSRRDLLDVAIVGAGVVGAAAALALARDGWQVALIEAREPPRWRRRPARPARVCIRADNAALLADLDVWPSIIDARAQPYRGMRVWDAAGGDELRFDADVFGRRELGWIVETRCWSIASGPRCRPRARWLRCPAQVIALQQDEGADHAALELDDGTRLRARLVLAADGGDSKLRTLAGIDTYTHDYGQNALVAFVDHARPHEATCWQRFLPTGPLAFLPFTGEGAGAGGHRSSIVWTLPEAEAARLLQVDDSGFLRELDNAFAGSLGTLGAVSKRVAFPLRRQLAQTHVAGRVAVIGDAAHVVHPLAGQGVNLGLRDVAALRALLLRQRTASRDPGAPVALARWARQRRSENAVAAYSFDGSTAVLERQPAGNPGASAVARTGGEAAATSACVLEARGGPCDPAALIHAVATTKKPA